MPEEHHLTARVTIFDHHGKFIKNAKVTLESVEATTAKKTTLKFDPHHAIYAASVAPGRYRLAAEADGYAGDERSVQVDPAGLQTVVILGERGLPFLYRGDVKTPFEPHGDLVGVALIPKMAGTAAERMLAIALQHGLAPLEVGEQVRRQHVHVFRFPPNTSAAEQDRIGQELRSVEGVNVVGPLVHFDKESVSILTNELVVKFRSHITLDELPEIAKRFNMEMLRRLPQAGNAFLFRLPGPVTYAMLDVAAKLVESGLVQYAEPNLFSTVVQDAINPTDFLFPMQWHLPLIHCPDAWQAINDNISPDFAFGSPNLNIAVVDSGVDLTNPDFIGNVSNGNPKVYKVFDFENMVANNNLRQGGHGTCCAGVATALANNASGVAGQNEGVSGSAGNCGLMAIEYPSPTSSTETEFSDMYVWVGGFDPHSSKAGFPAPITPGADVITSSYGVFPDMPISGLMKDTFDFLTTYGRGGRGVLLFFSADNHNKDFTLDRPWAAYTRTFAVAASTLSTDGVTEIRAPYSDFGGAATIDFCAPSDTHLNDPYDPPRSYGIVTTGADNFSPDTPSHSTIQTSTSGAFARATNLTVGSSAGFAVGQFIVIGVPGSVGAEFSKVIGIPDGTHLTVAALKNTHVTGTTILGGPAHSRTDFGGTSSATPLTAGVGALLLSVRHSLTWIQVRDILRGTAVKIDNANTDPIGIWMDVNGIASNAPGYLGPNYSRWYGFGRIDALAAVNAAITFGAAADVLIRENLGDNGTVPAVGHFWDSPDIWVRNLSPATEGAAALPANYTTPGPTQDVETSHDNYIYVRVKNIGPVATSDFYVRIYLTHFAGTEFVYPDNFVPTNHPGQPLPLPLVPGTYLIGEVQYSALAPNATDIVNVVWPQAAIPPQNVMVGGMNVHWHPCLLVEVSPQDGPLPSGMHVWDNNNLAQKNVTINYAADDGSFASALVAGNLLNESDLIELVFDRTLVPDGVGIYLDVLNPKARRELQRLVEEGREQAPCPAPEVVLLEETRVLIGCQDGPRHCASESIVTLPRHSRLKLAKEPTARRPRGSGLTLGHYKGREVFWLNEQESVRVPLLAGPGTLVPLMVGGVAAKTVKSGSYLIGITQVDAGGHPSGAAAVELRVK